ncbi:concanavalin A-like lectin/glucanase domain-containing protein [Mycena vulgaris]|nr:concanavalin A-like lectin/glucanase domain-containing protein [Mycena vulgaris]
MASSSSSSRPAPLSFAAFPPNAPFANDDEPPSPTTLSRGPSPPVTPRSLSFLTPPVTYPATPANNAASNTTAAVNPFSPPASVRSFSASGANGGADSPQIHYAGSGAGGYFSSPNSTRASSLVDVPRAGDARGSLSRPSTGQLQGQGSQAASKREAFASPPSRPMTIYASPSTARLRRGRPKSTAILVPSAPLSPAQMKEADKEAKKAGGRGVRPTLKGVLDKPWVGTRDPHRRLAYWITYATICLGIAAGAARIYVGWTSVLLLQGNLCPVLMEDFTGKTTADLFGDNGVFFREVDASGFGNGEFEMTTGTDANSYVKDGQLYILPTLTSDVIPTASILDGAVYNLTDCTFNITHASGYTTSGHGAAGVNTTEGTGASPDAPLDLPAYLAACSAVSNATEGKILPPVMSARISTRKSASLRFGRVEVRAKLPTGDWLWPAIWMLPVGATYGGWPLSGEIDIMEARGNGPSYPKQGINYVRSSLNWGPATFLNAVAKTYGWKTQRRGRYDEEFHTYALEWSEDFMRMYVDSRLTHMLELKINQPFWNRGDFPPVVQNGTDSIVLANPWINGTKAAPFDQPFYLIMNVAVGGTNGWFPDGTEKPWLDGSATAPLDFLRAQDKWYQTWPQDPAERAMVIDSVKMWEQC